MKKIALLFFILISKAPHVVAQSDDPATHRQVTIRITYQSWNEYRPWQKNAPQTRTCCGTVVAGNRILMLSQHLEDANLIQVEKFDRPPRAPARIIHCDHQAGLALITVDEPGFFDNLTPVDLAPTCTGEDFYCTAWKAGQLSRASCRWSRVTVLSCATPYFAYAAVHFITDLKGGGHGEPVFSGEKMVGLTKGQTDNRINVIPSELLHAYLNAANNMDTYPGFGYLGLNWQYNEGEAQSAYFGLPGKPRGIRVRSCFPGGTLDGILQPDDILLELDGHKLDARGDYVHPRYGQVDFKLIATEGHYAGDNMTAKVWRNGSLIDLQFKLKNIPPESDLIPKTRHDVPPPFLVAGGLIFRELDVPYLKAWGDAWYDSIPAYYRILYKLQSDLQSTSGQDRRIILADVFPDEYNLGYHDLAQNIVKTVNGQPIHSIHDMETAFQNPKGRFHIIEFDRSYSASKVILDAEKFKEATQSIMEKYQIPSRIRLRQK